MSAHTAVVLAHAHALSGRPDDSLPLLGWASDLALRPDFRTGQSRLLVSMGEVHLLAGRAAEAHRFADRALATARDYRQRGDEALALRLAGDIASRAEPPAVEEAEGRYREGLALATQLGMRPLAAHCHLGLGTLYGRSRTREQAREHLTAAATSYRDMDMRFWLEKAEAELVACH
jgi:tetratricopeptide (TPR) repeat protein